MPTWNRDVSVDADELGVSLPASGANPSDHPHDTADTIHIDGPDRSSGAKVKYHAQQPTSPILSLHLTTITPCPPTTQQDLDHLRVDTHGKDVHIHVGTGAPLETYSYHVAGYVRIQIGSGHVDVPVETPEPQIHNET
ncbi:MAG: hypothetical protein PVJ02_18975 [Gemmatimonadota bacterium]|jgi:hypothetical protein